VPRAAPPCVSGGTAGQAGFVKVRLGPIVGSRVDAMIAVTTVWQFKQRGGLRFLIAAEGSGRYPRLGGVIAVVLLGIGW